MNKKIKLFLGLIVFAVMIGTAVYRTAPSLSATFQARVADFKEYRFRQQVMSCINSDMPSVTAVGVHFMEDGKLAILISFVGTEKETMVLAYQHVISCALRVPDWESIYINDMLLQPVETLDDGDIHFTAVIYDRMNVPRSWAEDIAAAPDVAAAEKLFTDGINSTQIGYMNLYFFGFPVTSDLVNGDLDLAIRRYTAAVEALKGE